MTRWLAMPVPGLVACSGVTCDLAAFKSAKTLDSLLRTQGLRLAIPSAGDLYIGADSDDLKAKQLVGVVGCTERQGALGMPGIGCAGVEETGCGDASLGQLFVTALNKTLQALQFGRWQTLHDRREWRGCGSWWDKRCGSRQTKKSHSPSLPQWFTADTQRLAA